jgi:hypothetical protein
LHSLTIFLLAPEPVWDTCWKLNRGSSGVQPLAWSLYQLCYPASIRCWIWSKYHCDHWSVKIGNILTPKAAADGSYSNSTYVNYMFSTHTLILNIIYVAAKLNNATEKIFLYYTSLLKYKVVQLFLVQAWMCFSFLI